MISIITPISKLLFFDWHGALQEELYTLENLAAFMVKECLYFQSRSAKNTEQAILKICSGAQSLSPEYEEAFRLAINTRLQDDPTTARLVCDQVKPAIQARVREKQYLDIRLAARLAISNFGLHRDQITSLSSGKSLSAGTQENFLLRVRELECEGRREDAATLREAIGLTRPERLKLLARKFRWGIAA